MNPHPNPVPLQNGGTASPGVRPIQQDARALCFCGQSAIGVQRVCFDHLPLMRVCRGRT